MPVALPANSALQRLHFCNLQLGPEEEKYILEKYFCSWLEKEKYILENILLQLGPEEKKYIFEKYFCSWGFRRKGESMYQPLTML